MGFVARGEYRLWFLGDWRWNPVVGLRCTVGVLWPPAKAGGNTRTKRREGENTAAKRCLRAKAAGSPAGERRGNLEVTAAGGGVVAPGLFGGISRCLENPVSLGSSVVGVAPG